MHRPSKYVTYVKVEYKLTPVTTCKTIGHQCEPLNEKQPTIALYQQIPNVSLFLLRGLKESNFEPNVHPGSWIATTSGPAHCALARQDVADKICVSLALQENVHFRRNHHGRSGFLRAIVWPWWRHYFRAYESRGESRILSGFKACFYLTLQIEGEAELMLSKLAGHIQYSLLNNKTPVDPLTATRLLMFIYLFFYRNCGSTSNTTTRITTRNSTPLRVI